jgi:tRNA(Leu) C34 or U34 (ribose-2'-O)-methylase TrmL
VPYALLTKRSAKNDKLHELALEQVSQCHEVFAVREKKERRRKDLREERQKKKTHNVHLLREPDNGTVFRKISSSVVMGQEKNGIPKWVCESFIVLQGLLRPWPCIRGLNLGRMATSAMNNLTSKSGELGGKM